MLSPETLQQRLHELIPLSRAMEIRVEALEAESLTLAAPLAPNRNHAGTAFAGSLYSLASLTGWALLRALVERHAIAAELVLATGTIRYRRPLAGELRASVGLPAAKQEEIIQRLRSGRSSRVTLEIELPDPAAPCASFTGNYAARPSR